MKDGRVKQGDQWSKGQHRVWKVSRSAWIGAQARKDEMVWCECLELSWDEEISRGHRRHVRDGKVCQQHKGREERDLLSWERIAHARGGMESKIHAWGEKVLGLLKGG